MCINLTALGLIFTAIGALILMLNNILTGWHQKVNGKYMKERYWWIGWRPFYRDTETRKLKVKWDRKVIVSWYLPPKYILEIIGFLFILIGTIIQIIGL